MALGQWCYYGRNDYTSRKLTALHESYRQGLLGFLGHLIWFVAAYSAPFLATFHNQLAKTHLVVFTAVLNQYVHFLFTYL